MDIKRLNINVNGSPSSGFSGDSAEFSRIAALVGAELPQSYIDFLRVADGGHPEIGAFCLGDPQDTIDVDWFYSLAAPGVVKLVDALSDWGPVLGPKKLPIGRDGGGNQIYIDLADAGSVWFLVHDQGPRTMRLAGSLTEFLDSLVPNPDFI